MGHFRGKRQWEGNAYLIKVCTAVSFAIVRNATEDFVEFFVFKDEKRASWVQVKFMFALHHILMVNNSFLSLLGSAKRNENETAIYISNCN